MDPTKRNNVSSSLRCALLSFFEQKDFSGETRARRIDLEGSKFSVIVVVYIHIYIHVDCLLSSTTYDCKKRKNDDCVSVTTVSNNRPISSERKWMFLFVKTRSTGIGRVGGQLENGVQGLFGGREV